ncbi:MAG TPA: DUF1501 domain-containing protein, partial [Planctomycetaceae bacterium]|nr:DUF1501 domain-containing protein [Planctomycetaceae bacterium]
MNAARIFSSRRRFLGQCVAGSSAMMLPSLLSNVFAADRPVGVGKAKACILVWLNGGPSHIDTFDPKPGMETNGPWSAIETKIPGVRFSDRLPELAKCADKLAIVRSMTSVEGDHGRGNYYVHTANRMMGNNDFPHLGSVVAHGMETRGELPPFVRMEGYGGDFKAGSGFLGLKYAPYAIYDDPRLGLTNAQPSNVRQERNLRRTRLLDEVNQLFATRNRDFRAQGLANFEAGVSRFLQSSEMAAFTL